MTHLTQYLIDLPLVPAILLKVTCVLSVGWILHCGLARKNPRWQVLLWRGVVVGVFMVTLLTPYHYMPIPVVRPSEPVLPAELFPVASPVVVVHTEAGPAPEPQSIDASQPSFSLSTWVFEHAWALAYGIWLLVTSVLVLRLVIGYIRVKHRMCASYPATEVMQQSLDRIARDLQCQRRIALRCSPDLATPFLTGVLRPTIILPEEMQDSERETQLPAMLTHELVHLMSGDLIWMLVTRLFSTVLWFHPLTWKLCDAHGKACEAVCDGVAADYVGDADHYAAVLAHVALRVSGRLPGLAGIPMAREANIVTRLRRLKQKIDSAPLTRQSVTICVLAGVILFTGLGGLNFVHADTDSHPPQDTASHDGTPTEGEIVALGPHEAESRSAVRETPDEAIWVPLPVILPKRTFEPRRGSPRLDFPVPRDVTNVALNKSVTASTDPPFKGTLAQIVDGDKEPVMEAEVELGRGTQWVQIDLESPHELFAILFWHFHRQERVYYDVVVQVADDPGFTRNVRTLFNNDDDNSSGLGVGRDQHYLETYEGKLVNAGQAVAQYVRLYSNENTLNDRSHYLEVEIYGRPVR
ncbi:MAG: M56 family metallopeptidase [Phycisphaerae bacterium]|nr:M56 family metallopeptidase [Phycisphaerae bacterium]